MDARRLQFPSGSIDFHRFGPVKEKSLVPPPWSVSCKSLGISGNRIVLLNVRVKACLPLDHGSDPGPVLLAEVPGDPRQKVLVNEV